jgi:hypothetical protein
MKDILKIVGVVSDACWFLKDLENTTEKGRIKCPSGNLTDPVTNLKGLKKLSSRYFYGWRKDAFSECSRIQKSLEVVAPPADLPVFQAPPAGSCLAPKQAFLIPRYLSSGHSTDYISMINAGLSLPEPPVLEL